MKTWSEIKASAEKVSPPQQKTATSSRIKFLSLEESNLVSELIKLRDATSAGDSEAFFTAIELALPAWKQQVSSQDYSRFGFRKVLEDRFDLDNHQRGLKDFSGTISTFLCLADGQDDATVDRWLHRIQRTITITGGYLAVVENVYTKSFDIEELIKIQARPKLYLFSAVVGVEKGFTVEEVAKIHSSFYHNYTPENLRMLRQSYTYKEINSLLTAFSSVKSLTTPSFDVLSSLLDAGFTNGAEFKTFVKNLRYSYGDLDLFQKVITVAQSLSPDDAAVLKNKNATAAEVAAVIVKL